MASFRERRVKGASPTTNMREEISDKKGFHVPPLTATMKESKKKRKDTTKEKKKSRNCINQSKDLEKLQTEHWTNGETSDAQSKGQAKAKERKISKSKNPKVVSEVTLVPNEEDKSDLTQLEQDSLRWEGALEDPIAEAHRLEVYRDNRRKRYMASRQAFLQNVHTGIRMDCKFSVDISSDGGKRTSKPSFRKDAEIGESEGMRAPRKGAWARGAPPHA